jgi:DNA-binding transcriptional MerR regulator
MNEYGFFSKEVALKLDINASTLRQWSLAMEKEGYEFHRNDKEQRIYYDRDINLLFELKNLIEKTRNRDDAIKQVVSRQKSVDNAEKLLSVNENERDNITVSKSDLEELIQMSVEKAIEKERDAMFKAFETKLNNTMEQRDRYLVQQLKESMEQQKLIAASQEEKKKKGFFTRLFGKG